MFKEMICNFSLKLISDGTIFTLHLDRHDFLIIAITLIVIFIVSLLKEKGIDVRESISKKNIIIRWSIYYALIIVIVLFGAYGARIQGSRPNVCAILGGK